MIHATGGLVRGFHHCAYRCQDSETTRAFYEDLLGLPLAASLAVEPGYGATGEGLHTFFALGDGSFLAFFELPKDHFSFGEKNPHDVHFALEVDADAFAKLRQRLAEAGVVSLAVVDHGLCHSAYFRDPNGYVVELTAKTDRHDQLMDPRRNAARDALNSWQARKAQIAPPAEAA